MNQLFLASLFFLLSALSLFVNGAVLKHPLVSSRSLKGSKARVRDPIESIAKAREAFGRLEKRLSRYRDKFYDHIKNKKVGKGKWLPPKKLSINPDIGNAMLLDYETEYYLVNISLGTPPQWFLVKPNLLSSDFWLIDSECDDEVCLRTADNFQRHLFNKSLSQTYASAGDDVTVPNFDASIASDKLTIGELNAQQNFALAYELESLLYKESMDGLLGLSSYPGIFDNVQPVMQTLKPLLDDPVFTISIRNKDDISDNDVSGQLTFGAQDLDNCESEWSYTWVNNYTFMSAFWEFQVNGFTVINGTKTIDNHRRRPAIIVLDFPFIAGPPGNIQTIAESMGFTFNLKYSNWVVPCSRINESPDLQFKIGQNLIVLKASQLITKINTGNGYTCALNLIQFENQGNGPAWYFGDLFLRSYCVSFEIGDGDGNQSVKKTIQIGFAKSKLKLD